MVQSWLVEFLKGTVKIFLNPVLYYLVFAAALIGVARVKRERRNFHVRAQNAYFELKQLLPLGIILGIVFSIISVAAGIVVPFAAILLICAFTLIWTLTLNLRMVSPAYTIGAAFFTLIIFAENKWSVPLFTGAFHSIGEKVYPSVMVILSMLLIGEGILIFKKGSMATSPKLAKSKRGQSVGVHEAKRIWMLPLFMLIPGNALTLPFHWWPIFHLGAEKFSLILVPFAVGFHQQIQGMLPKEAIQLHGKRVITFGVVLTILSVCAYWVPLLSIVAAAIAVIGREAISLVQKMSDEGKPFYFSRKNNGLMIIGILPESPASKMELKVGELISKVNGVIVRDEQSLYEALSKNRAHCKLEVIDTNGEIRFVQRALYEGDHHELGILFVPNQRKYDEKIG